MDSTPVIIIKINSSLFISLVVKTFIIHCKDKTKIPSHLIFSVNATILSTNAPTTDIHGKIQYNNKKEKNIAPRAPIAGNPFVQRSLLGAMFAKNYAPTPPQQCPPSKIQRKLLRIRERSFGLTRTVVWANANGCEKASQSLPQRLSHPARTGHIPYKALFERSKGTI